MAKRKKAPPPFRVFDDEELVDWPRGALYEYAPDMAAVDRLVSADRKNGRPRETLKAMRELVLPLAEDGEHVVLASPAGDVGCLPVRLFADLLFRTRNSEMAGGETLQRLARSKVDLVKVIGSRSPHFCTAYVGLVFSVSGRDGRYPPLSVIPNGGCPLHPGCTKSLVAFVPELADAAAVAGAILRGDDLRMVNASLSPAVRMDAARARAARISAGGG